MLLDKEHAKVRRARKGEDGFETGGWVIQDRQMLLTGYRTREEAARRRKELINTPSPCIRE
jgi:hypothetical protein